MLFTYHPPNNVTYAFAEFDSFFEIQIKHILHYEIYLDFSGKLGFCLFCSHTFFFLKILTWYFSVFIFPIEL